MEGEYIYIPKKEENKIPWGELTQSKKALFYLRIKYEVVFTKGIMLLLISNGNDLRG